MCIGRGVYKDKRLTGMETFSFINLVCLSFMTILFTESYDDIVSVNVIVSASVSVEILLFIIIVTVYCYLAYQKVFPNYTKLCNLCCKICVQSSSQYELPLIDNDTEEAHVREELIF